MDQEKPPFSDVFETLRYVKQCHPRFDNGKSANITRFLFYISRVVGGVGALMLTAPFAYGFDVGATSKISPGDRAIMDMLLLVATGFLGLFYLLWLWEKCRSFPKSVGPSWEILARRADCHARELLQRSQNNVPLMNYAKDILKADLDELEWSAGSIGKDVGLLAIGALGASMIKGWSDFKTLVVNAKWVGINAAELISSVAMLLAFVGLSLVIFAWFWRAVAKRLRYHIGVIDTALRLKELDEEKGTEQTSSVQSPADLG